MPSRLEVVNQTRSRERVAHDDRAGTLTFEAFRRACGLPPSMQLAVFLRLPPERQAQAWGALRTELDANNENAA